jgi:hypothetical protein
VRFVETRVFTEAVTDLLSDDEYSTLQHALILRPDLGVVIPGGGGIRKVRWREAGRGKRSGIRVVYYWQVTPDRFYMLYAYRKSEAGDLTQAQLRFLRGLIVEVLE